VSHATNETCSIARVAREVQALALARRVELGELTYAQGERMSLYLDLERLGVVSAYYPPSVLASRKREARQLGLSTNESGAEPIEAALGELLARYRETVEALAGCSSGSPAAAGAAPAA
jgi:hypothetical protein